MDALFDKLQATHFLKNGNEWYCFQKEPDLRAWKHIELLQENYDHVIFICWYDDKLTQNRIFKGIIKQTKNTLTN